jgi:NADPH:quinone reductase-like Zn-dependent oxidoreductase
MAAIQICKLAGGYVYATSSADWKLVRAKELGADEVINYNSIDFVDEILRRTNKRGVDLVVEHVGGDFLDKSIRCLTRGGRVVTVGGTKSYDCKISINYIFHKELKLIGSNSATKHDLEVMMPLLGSGKLKTVIDKVFPLQAAADAHRYLEAARQFGKVILRVDH